MYKINNIDLATFGITPIQISGQSLATSGVFDFPNRKGTTEHNWGTETELFVAAADLVFDGRDIAFRGLMRATTRTLLLTNLNGLITLCQSGSLSFETRVGIFQVYMSAEMQVSELSDTIITIEIKFRQPVVLFPVAPGIVTAGTGYKIAGYNFKSDFGITVNSLSERLSVPARIEVNTTAFYMNSTYRQPKDISINCTMLGSNISDLTNKMGRLHGLLVLPGLKVLAFPDGATANVYLKSGFNVSGITEYNCHFTLVFRQP